MHARVSAGALRFGLSAKPSKILDVHAVLQGPTMDPRARSAPRQIALTDARRVSGPAFLCQPPTSRA
jgi:hypothetical protein